MSETDMLSPGLLRGLVERCLDLGLSADQTEMVFRKAAANQILANPNINRGFQEGLTKAARVNNRCMIKAASPEFMVNIVETRLRFGDDPLSQITRKAAGWAPVQNHQLNEPMIKAASQLSSTLQGFDRMPLNQQMMLAMMLGSGGGAAYRAFKPTGEDQAEGRNVFSRASRGAARGAAVGAGAAAGGRAGSFGSDVMARGQMKLPMMGMGALAGGAAANRLIDSV